MCATAAAALRAAGALALLQAAAHPGGSGMAVGVVACTRALSGRLCGALTGGQVALQSSQWGEGERE